MVMALTRASRRLWVRGLLEQGVTQVMQAHRGLDAGGLIDAAYTKFTTYSDRQINSGVKKMP